MRHGRLCAHLCYSVCKALGIETTEKWYTYTKASMWTWRCNTVMESRSTHR